METIAINTKATHSQKGSIAILLQTLDKSPLPSPNASFASILNEKTVPIPDTSGDTNVPVNNMKAVSGHKGKSEAVDKVKEGSNNEPAMTELSDPAVSQKAEDTSRFDLSLMETTFMGTSVPVIPQSAPEATEQDTIIQAGSSEIGSAPAPKKDAPTGHSLSISVIGKLLRSTDILKPINPQSVENLLTADTAPPSRTTHKVNKAFVNRVASAVKAEQTDNKTESASIISTTDLSPAARNNQAVEITSINRTVHIPVMRNVIKSTDTMKQGNLQSAENVFTADLTPAVQVVDRAEIAFVSRAATSTTAEQTDHKAESSSIFSASDLTQATKDNRETEIISVNHEASLPVIQEVMQSSDTIKPANLQSAEILFRADLTPIVRAAYKAEAAFVNHVAASATARQADYKNDTAQIGAGADLLSAANDSNGVETGSIIRVDEPVASGNGHKRESAFMNRVADMIRQKDDSQAAENTLSQVRRTAIELQDYGRQTMPPREMAAAVETQKPIPAPTSHMDKEAAIKQAATDRMESLELLHEAVTMKDEAATVADPTSGNDRNKSVVTIVQAKSAGHETLIFRMDASSLQPTSDTGKTASEGSAGIHTQAIIDQIIDAKQAAGNDYGRIRIVLDPPNLGTVDLNIIVRKDRVSVVMTADNASVQQVLQSHGDSIRAAFQRQDMRIETFQVLLQDNGVNQQQFQGGAMHEQRREHQSRQAISDADTVIPVSPSVVEAIPARGLVSIFV